MSDNFGTINEEDVFKVLVATDIHLGYEEKDPIRDHDTFDTFEEILQIAEAEEVDFVLLGGDLFHHAKPSPYCIYKCTELLRRYCLGDKPVQIEFMSNPNNSFSTSMVNYEDPNLNISIPVFSIHGNHDDPTGQKQISAMDLLATSGLINYFGRCKSYDEVEIEPICFKKGETRLALYGLSHVKDERLGRLFIDKKVSFRFLKDDQYFNLLVWHQNRAARGTKNFIPDDSLPEKLDLVIWGHEHDCRIEAEEKNTVFISQPGSSVATSLIEGESITKKVGLLKICKKNFHIYPIELKSVRPFIYKDLILKTVEEMNDMNDGSLTPIEFTMDMVRTKVEEMIAEAKRLGRNPRVSEKPLIRLNVRCRDEKQIFNTIRFGQDYMGKVANPEDMVKCHLIKEKRKIGKSGECEIDTEDVATASRVEDIVSAYFEENDTLKLFPVSIINETVKKFIDANNTEAISCGVSDYGKQVLKKLEEDMPEIPDVETAILNFKKDGEGDALQHISDLLNDPNRQKTNSAQRSVQASDDDVFVVDDDDNFPVPPKTGRGSRVGRGSRGGQQRAKSARGSARSMQIDDDDVSIVDDDDDNEFTDLDSDNTQRSGQGIRRYFGNSPPKVGPGSRGGKGSRGGRGSRSRGRSK